MTVMGDLVKKHMTADEFSRAVWLAHDNLFCTTDEAIAAIEKYKRELELSAHEVVKP